MKSRFATAWVALLFALPAQASEESGGGLAEQLLWPAFNLVVLIVVLVYFARKPLRDYFASRRSEIQSELTGAADQLAEAEATYAKWQRRLADLEADLEGIRAASRQRAETERDKIVSDARAAAERIRRDASVAVEMEFRRARGKLREEATQLAIELATERLEREVTDADRDRLLDEFIDRIEVTPSLDSANQGST
jgi:F-type H+-transporting ATPase subunit b